MTTLLRSGAILIALLATLPGQFGVATVGEPHPDFLLRDLDGKPGRLSAFRGKPVLLFHFASW